MFPFSFSISHSLTVFLSIFRTAPLGWSSLFSVFYSLSNSRTHTKIGRTALCASALHSRPNGLCFLSFLLFSFSVSHKEWHADFGSFASLLVERSQTFPCMLSFALNQRADFVGLRRQPHKWALTRVASKWAVPTRCLHPTSLSTRMKR